MAGAILATHQEWRDWVLCDSVQEDFLDHAKQVGYLRRSSETELGMALGKLIPGLRRVRRSVGNRRPYVYEFPPLAQCRAEFEKRTRMKNPWPDDDD